jgi:hypothetical protein
MGKTFGVPLNDNVAYQLKYRKSLLKDDNLDQTVLRTSFINNQTSYIRLVSGVNSLPENEEEYLKSLLKATHATESQEEIKAYFNKGTRTDSVLAQSNILSGGTVYNKYKDTGKLQEYRKTGFDLPTANEVVTRSSYEFSEVGGYVPMMGITDFIVRSKSQYGTLREVEIKIKAWSIEQLDIIEKLYFKPGFTMLVEWGNSVYLNYSGKMETGIGSVTKDFIKASVKRKDLIASIESKKKRSGNNYDAMLGSVINFGWDYGTDGSYDCTIKILGKGEVLESVKSTFYTGYNSSGGHRKYAQGSSSSSSGKAEKDDHDLLLEIFKALTNTSSLKNYLKRLYPRDNKIKVYKSGLSQTEDDWIGEEEDSTDYQYFITIRDLLYILNTQILNKEDSGADKTRFSLDIDAQEYITFPGHVSGDPYICGIPYKSGNTKFEGGQMPDVKSFTGYGFKSSAKIPKEIYDSRDLKAKAPLNILVNLAYLQGLQRASVKKLKEKDAETSVYQLVKSVLKDISTALGGVNDLDLHLDHNNEEWFVIDRNLYEPITAGSKKLPVIDIVGLGSMVTSYSLSSKISSNMTSLLSIAASAGKSSFKGQDNLVQFNNGSVDRWQQSKETKEEKDKKEFPKDTLQNSQTRQQNKIKIAKAYYSYATSKINDDSNFGSIATSHKEAMKFCLKMFQLKKRQGNAPPPTNILLPIEMSLTMQGIAGLKIGEAFTVTEELLPQRYRGRVGFVITGLTHKISSDNRWEMDIKSNMFMLPVKDVSVDISTLVDLTEQPDPPGYNDPVEESTGETPNADQLRAVIKSAGFSEKGTELANGGDITSDTLKIGTALINTVKSEAPGIKLRFTSGNDKFHQNITSYTSRHKSGRALDFTIVPYSVSNYKKVLAIVQGFAAGSSSSSIRFKDEYKRMTVKATGVHFHFSWGRGTEGNAELAESRRLAIAGKIKTYTV